MTADKFAKLKEACDRAVMDAQHWSEVCDEVSALFGGEGSLFLPVIPKGRGPWLIYSDSITELMERYFEGGWHQKDYREKGTELCLKNGYMTDHDFVSREEMENIPYYKDLFFPLGLGICIGMTVETENGTWGIAIQCKKDRKPLSKEEVQMIYVVRQILYEATQKAEEYSLEKMRNFTSLLGETKNDILILDADGEILQRHDGIGIFAQMNKGKLGARFKHILDNSSHDQFEAVCNCTANENNQANIIQELEDQKISMNMMQLPPSIRHYYSRAKVIVLASLLSTTSINTDNILSEVYGLTSSEIIAVNLLTQGCSLKNIAKKLELAESTIRQRFKNIYSKTGMSSQAQLVSLLFRIEKG